MIKSTKKIKSICLRAMAGTLFIVAFLMVGTYAHAEEPDLRASGELAHSYAEGATINLAHEHRLRLKSLKLHETFTDIGTYYQLTEDLTIGGVYRVSFSADGGQWNLERRPYIDVIGKLDVFSLGVTLRPRVEYRVNSGDANFRYRLEAGATFKEVLFQPFVADEVFFASDGGFEENRVSVGLSPTKTVDVFYLLQTEHGGVTEYTNIFGLNYKFDL
ncbi:MAG TPA: DUF2490 domain-containing protein [Pseudomonadales bacterium]|nr:DUF2490 domain-containing protein [Pseudomonadales bacterium]